MLIRVQIDHCFCEVCILVCIANQSGLEGQIYFQCWVLQFFDFWPFWAGEEAKSTLLVGEFIFSDSLGFLPFLSLCASYGHIFAGFIYMQAVPIAPVWVQQKPAVTLSI